MAEEYQTAHWLYLGPRDLDRNGKLSHLWLDHEGQERYFTKPIVKYGRAGGVYLIHYQALEQGRFSVGTSGAIEPRFVEWTDHDTRLQAETASRAAEASARAIRLLRQEGTEAMLRQQLEPIRELMRNTDRTGRRAIAATVLDILNA